MPDPMLMTLLIFSVLNVSLVVIIKIRILVDFCNHVFRMISDKELKVLFYEGNHDQ